MMHGWIGGTLIGAALLLPAAPALGGELSTVLDLSLRWGDGRVTMGGRVEGPGGPTSGTVTGRLRPGGVTVDGWLDDRGRTWTFEFDANALEGLRAIIRKPPQRI
jgi:hypothetical protein